MVNVLLYENGKYIKAETDDLEAVKTKRAWIQLTAPTEPEVQSVTQTLNVPEDFVRSALDDEERARIDEDDDTGFSLIVFDIPVPESADDESDAPYTTLPLSVIQKDNLTITVCLQDSPKFNDIKNGNEKKNILLESDKLIYQLLLSFHAQYGKYLRLMDKVSSRLESQLSKRPNNNDDLLKLMKSKNALIYFASSLRQNILVVNKLLSKKITDDDAETLENIGVEVEQAFDTCNLQRDLMTETMNTYSNIVNNQLAERMRMLTVVTIILAIPTLIAGLWGMNLKLPFADLDNMWGFWIICAIIIVCCVGAFYWVSPRKVITAPRKKKRKRK